MKKLIYIVLGLLVFVLIGLFAAPSFIDVNDYKDEISSQFKKKTGYDLTLDGEISLSLFPLVKATVKDVSVANKSKIIASVKEITVYPKIMPLFSKEVVVDSIKVIKPSINIEKSAGVIDITARDYTKQVAEKSATVPSSAPKAKSQVKFSSIEIIDGEFKFTDKDAKKEYEANDINAKSSLDLAAEDVEVDAKLKYKKKDFNLKAAVKKFTSPDLTLDLNYGGTQVKFGGNVAAGKVAVKSDDIIGFLNALEVTPAKADKVAIDYSSDVAYQGTGVKLDNINMAIGSSKGAGSLSYDDADTRQITANLKFANINSDELMSLANSFTKEAEKKESTEDKNSKESFVKEASAAQAKKLETDIELTSDKFIYKKAEYNNLVVSASSDDEDIIFRQVRLGFPDEGKLEILGAVTKDSDENKSFEGEISLKGSNLSKFLKAQGIDVEKQAANGAFGQYGVSANILANVQKKTTHVDLSNLALKLDDTNFNGSLAADVEEGKLPKLKLVGAVDFINVEKLSPPEEAPKQTKNSAADSTTTRNMASEEKYLKLPWLDNFPIEADFNLVVGAAKLKFDDFANIKVVGNIAPGKIDLSQVSAASKKIQLSARGSVLSEAQKKPKFKVEANIGSIDLANFKGKSAPKSGEASSAVEGDAGVKSSKSSSGKWSDEPFDLSFMNSVDVDFAANIGSVKSDKIVFDTIFTKGFLDGGRLSFEKFQGGLFGGTVNIGLNLIAGAVPSMSVSISAGNVDVYKVLDALADNQRVSGKISYSGAYQTSGISQKIMISNLEGTGNVSGKDIMVKGFDFDAFVNQITNISDVSGIVSILRIVAVEDGATYIPSLGGPILTRGGIFKTEGINVDAGSGQGVYKGYADLMNWNMDTNADIKLVLPNDKDTPSLGIRIYGQIDNPSKDINADKVKRYVSERAAKGLLKSGQVPEKLKPLLQDGGAQKELNKGIEKLENKIDPATKDALQDKLKGFLGGK